MWGNFQDFDNLKAIPYEKKRATKLALLFICEKKYRKKENQQHKIDLFILSKMVIISNIENFFALKKKYNVENFFHEKEDILLESWIILDNCLNTFMRIPFYNYGKKHYTKDSPIDLKNIKKYDWINYFNKSLTRSLYRLFCKIYMKNDYKQKVFDSDNFVDILDWLLSERQADSSNIPIDSEFMEFELKNLNFNLQETKLILSRLREEKLDEFLKLNKDITRNNYFKILKQVKEKMYAIRTDKNIE